VIQEVVQRILQDPEFPSGQLQVLLAYLLDRTLEGGPGASASDISARIFGDRSEKHKVAARGLVSRLVKHLKEVQRVGYRQRVVVTNRPYLVQLEGDDNEIEQRPLPEYPEKLVPPRSADPLEFLQLVKSIHELEHPSDNLGDLSQRFFNWAQRSNDDQTLRGQAMLYLATAGPTASFEHFVSLLEKMDSSISIDGVRSCARVFNVHPLLLDRLLSETTNRNPLILDLKEDFFDPTYQGRIVDDSRGEQGAVYKIQSRKLANADATFVSLTLLKRISVSAKHEHPGDEIIFVRRGRVDVEFETSGIRHRLGAGDLIHFYAEQRHQVHNASDEEAELFIVRYYQLDAEHTRQGIWREIEANLAKESPLSSEAGAWLHQLVPRYSPQARSEVVDALGLARYLKEHRASGVTSDIEQIAEPREFLSMYQLLESAVVPDGLSLIEIAKLYGIRPALLKGYSKPAVPGMVAIHRTDYFETENFYRVPTRSLSCSDVSLAKVSLPPGAQIDPNVHPGFEAILMTAGRLELKLGDEPDSVYSLSNENGQFCHFRSSRSHFLRNPSRTVVAEFLVMRFFRDGVHGRE
jgi:quercetin dioxygenase-like cupin family protein